MLNGRAINFLKRKTRIHIVNISIKPRLRNAYSLSHADYTHFFKKAKSQVITSQQERPSVWHLDYLSRRFLGGFGFFLFSCSSFTPSSPFLLYSFPFPSFLNTPSSSFIPPQSLFSLTPTTSSSFTRYLSSLHPLPLPHLPPPLTPLLPLLSQIPPLTEPPPSPPASPHPFTPSLPLPSQHPLPHFLPPLTPFISLSSPCSPKSLPSQHPLPPLSCLPPLLHLSPPPALPNPCPHPLLQVSFTAFSSLLGNRLV